MALEFLGNGEPRDRDDAIFVMAFTLLDKGC